MGCLRLCKSKALVVSKCWQLENDFRLTWWWWPLLAAYAVLSMHMWTMYLYIHVHMCSNFLVELIMWGLLQLLSKKKNVCNLTVGITLCKSLIYCCCQCSVWLLHARWTWEQCSYIEHVCIMSPTSWDWQQDPWSLKLLSSIIVVYV